MKIKNYIIGILVLLFAFSSQSLAASFGMSPPEITNKSLRPGSDFIYVIDLSTNDPAEDMRVETEVLGDPFLVDWVTIKSDNLIMPKGKAHVPMHVQLKVPSDAATGRYKGRISVAVSPLNQKGGQIALRLGGAISLDFEVVGGRVTDYLVQSVSLNEIKYGEPLVLSLKVKNSGNTSVEKIDTELMIVDSANENILKKLRSNRLSKSIPPHVTDNANLTLSVGNLSPGRYQANVKAKGSGDTYYENQYSLLIRDTEKKSIDTVKRVETKITSSVEEKSMTMVEKVYQFLVGPWFILGSLLLVLITSFIITRLRH